MSAFVKRLSGLLNRVCVTGLQVRCPVRRFAIDSDGDILQMRTTVTFLNQEQDQGIFIDTYSSAGFRLNSGIRVMGPCVVFPRSVLHWNIANVHDINEESLSLFTMLEPKLDILVMGVGERENLSKVNPNIIKYLRLHKINMEILPTDQALATFNFLNAEKRYVAGAFMPPSYVHAFEDDDIHKGVPVNLDPAVLPDKEFEGSEDDDLTPIMNEGRKRLQELRNRSDEQENKGRYD